MSFLGTQVGVIQVVAAVSRTFSRLVASNLTVSSKLVQPNQRHTEAEASVVRIRQILVTVLAWAGGDTNRFSQKQVKTYNNVL